MAIFRAGKRVGPFDLRVGFPRDRSMDNIDRDPRLRKTANSENTIGRFRASMAAADEDYLKIRDILKSSQTITQRQKIEKMIRENVENYKDFLDYLLEQLLRCS